MGSSSFVSFLGEVFSSYAGFGPEVGMEEEIILEIDNGGVESAFVGTGVEPLSTEENEESEGEGICFWDILSFALFLAF